MHRHRAMYNGGYTHPSTFPYHSHQGINVGAPYEVVEPVVLPDLSNYPLSYYPDYPYRPAIAYADHASYDHLPRVVPRSVSPTIIQTNVHNDISYHFDEPDVVYADEYAYPYGVARPKFQLVNPMPRYRIRREHPATVISTVRTTEPAKRMIVPPRSTIIRNTSLPTYHQPARPVRLMPLYHSADPHYLVTNRVRPVVKQVLPMATVYNSYHRSPRRIVRVRSFSP
jgi:hypothetical protein